MTTITVGRSRARMALQVAGVLGMASVSQLAFAQASPFDRGATPADYR